MMRAARWALLAALALGCQGEPADAVDGAVPSHDTQSTDAMMAADGRAPDGKAAPVAVGDGIADALALTRWSLFAALPAEALAAVAVDAPAAVFGRLGGGETLAAAGPALGALRAAARAQTGHDLFDPASWAHFGIAADRPAGVALLSVDPPIVAVGVGLVDREKLRTLVYAHAAGELPVGEDTRDGITWLTLDRAVLALGSDAAWLVIGEGLLPGEALAYARTIGGGGFAARPRIGAALARLGEGRDLAAVLDVPALVEAGLRRARSPLVRRAERVLRAAEAVGGPAAIEAARANDSAAKANPDRPLGDAVAAGLGRAMLAPLGPAALGLTLEPGAARVAFAMGLEAGSDPAALFRARPGPRPVASVFERPVVMLDVVVDPEAAWRLAGSAALAAGASGEWAAMQAGLRAALGVEPEALVAALAGGVGVAVALDPRGMVGVAGPEGVPARLRVAAHVGVEDPAWAQARLDALAAGGALRVAGAGRWSVRFAGLDFTIALRGPRVLVASAPGLIDRFAPAAPPSTAAPFTAALPAPLPALLGGEHGGTVGWLDLAGLGALMLDHRPVFDVTPLPPGDPLAELRAVEIAIEDAQRADREAEQKRGRAMLAGLGVAALAVEPAPGGVVARGGVFVGATDVGAALRGVLRFAEEEARAVRELWPKTLQPLYDRRSRLLDAASPQPGVPR